MSRYFDGDCHIVIGHCPHDLRDHIITPPDIDISANGDAFTADIIEVVQGCPFDSDAGQFHRFKDGRRDNSSGATDVPFDIQESRRRFFGLKLIGDSPARELDGIT